MVRPWAPLRPFARSHVRSPRSPCAPCSVVAAPLAAAPRHMSAAASARVSTRTSTRPHARSASSFSRSRATGSWPNGSPGRWSRRVSRVSRWRCMCPTTTCVAASGRFAIKVSCGSAQDAVACAATVASWRMQADPWCRGTAARRRAFPDSRCDASPRIDRGGDHPDRGVRWLPFVDGGLGPERRGCREPTGDSGGGSSIGSGTSG